MNSRFLKIIELCQNGRVSVKDIIAKMDVSAATIRRDLVEMEEKKLIKRAYGTVELNEEIVDEPNMHFKELANNAEKNRIAKRASYLIENNNIVYIDGGTTTSKIVDYLFSKDVLVVTHSLTVANKCAEHNIKCYMLGGYLRHKTNVFIREASIDYILEQTYDVGFIGCNGMNESFGFTSSDEMEAMIKKAVIKSSKKCYICVDSSKIGILGTEKVCDFKEANVIIDSLGKYTENQFKSVILAKKVKI